MSATDGTNNQGIGIIEFFTGKDDRGQPIYCYVSIDPLKYEDYLEKVAAGELFDPADFGRIIKSGHGKMPPPDIMREMERVYNLHHNFEEMMENELDAFVRALHDDPKEK